MKKYLTLTTLAGLLFTGCSHPTHLLTTPSKPVSKQHVVYQKPIPEKETAFHETMMKVALSTKEDNKYNKMQLNTPEKKAWFKNLMYKLWDRQISRKQFIAEGLTKYPTHRYEFTFVANGFQKYS